MFIAKTCENRWVKKILHNPKTKNVHPKYRDLIEMYKIEQPIKVKRNVFTQTVKRYIPSLKEMKTREVTSWHGYQLAEQIVKIDTGTAWPSAGMRWLAPAKTGFDLEVKKKQVRLAPGTTLHGYD